MGANADQGSVYVFTPYTTQEDVALTIAAPGLLANDTDANGDALTPSVVAQPAHGTASVNANGSFLYTPAANWNGTDTFTYRVSDGTAYSNNAVVTVRVVAVNDPPVALPDGVLPSQVAKLLAADGAGGDTFGVSVAISGDTMVVGAPYDDVAANADQGSARVFVRSERELDPASHAHCGRRLGV